MSVVGIRLGELLTIVAEIRAEAVDSGRVAGGGI